MSLWAEIIISLAAIASFGVALLELRKRKKTERENTQMRSEMDLARSVLNFGHFIKEWGYVQTQLSELIKETEIDRFMILRAWNGVSDPKWTTAVYQMRKEGQAAIQYIHFELDDDYRQKLKSIELNNIAQYRVADMTPPSAIKEVYDAEGVKASIWGLINKEAYGEGVYAITYVSFASTSVDDISPETATRCKILLGRLKGASDMFNEASNAKT